MKHVHHITPARSDKNYGLAINQLIEHLPDNDWICLRDIDTIPPFHEAFIRQVEEIANNPQGYDLIGCMTNRLGLKHQLHEGQFSSNHNIEDHYSIGKNYQGFEIQETDKIIAGMFMAFQKKTFDLVGGFQENDKYFDIDFNFRVKKAGLKVGIMKGLYIYHMYRIWNKTNPFDDYGHLE